MCMRAICERHPRHLKPVRTGSTRRRRRRITTRSSTDTSHPSGRRNPLQREYAPRPHSIAVGYSPRKRTGRTLVPMLHDQRPARERYDLVGIRRSRYLLLGPDATDKGRSGSPTTSRCPQTGVRQTNERSYRPSSRAPNRRAHTEPTCERHGSRVHRTVGGSHRARGIEDAQGGSAQ